MTTTHLQASKEIYRFRQNKEAVGRLQELLSDPVMKSAMTMVENLSRPSVLPELTPTVHHDTSIAHYMHMLIGVNKAFSMLKRMAIDVDSEDDRDFSEDEVGDFEAYGHEIKAIKIPKIKP
jgi:hypothetical protein